MRKILDTAFVSKGLDLTKMQIFIISLKHSVIRKESYSKLTNCYILTKRWFLSIEWIKHFIRASNRNTMSFCHGSLFYYNENKLFKLLESRFIFWVNYCSAFNIVQFLTWNLESTFIKFCNGFNLSSNHFQLCRMASYILLILLGCESFDQKEDQIWWNIDFQSFYFEMHAVMIFQTSYELTWICLSYKCDFSFNFLDHLILEFGFCCYVVKLLLDPRLYYKWISGLFTKWQRFFSSSDWLI